MGSAELRRFIEVELGIMMPPTKEALLHSRLQRRLAALALPSLEAYATYLHAAPAAAAERRELYGAITTNTTEFFREASHLDVLVDAVAPAVRAAEPHRTFLVWSAGCATGEEPYTLAMVLAEAARAHRGWDFAILATDVSPRALAEARRGVYADARTAGIPAALAARHLMAGRGARGGLRRIRPELRAKVAFHELNFMATHYPVADAFDAIFFRNVAIYFDRPTQEAVIGRLCRHLRPGGYLFIGQTESLIGRDVPVTFVGGAVYQRPVGGPR
jgi:chemotaxis protein methyltransferase CheR